MQLIFINLLNFFRYFLIEQKWREKEHSGWPLVKFGKYVILVVNDHKIIFYLVG